MSALKTLLTNLMTMEYVRVRKSNIKELEELIEQRRAPDWHLITAVVGLVVAVAITGLALIL